MTPAQRSELAGPLPPPWRPLGLQRSANSRREFEVSPTRRPPAPWLGDGANVASATRLPADGFPGFAGFDVGQAAKEAQELNLTPQAPMSRAR